MPVIIPDDQKTSRIFTNVIPANSNFRLSGAAEMFYVISTSGPVAIKNDNGVEELFSAKQGKRCYKDNYFNNMEVRNPSGAPLTVAICYGFGWFIDNSIV